MTRTIVFANRKGGCGKTTTVVNTAHALAQKGRTVLVADMDPQAHAGICLGHSPGDDTPGMFHLLGGTAGLDEVILSTSVNGIRLIPASRNLSAFEIECSQQKGSEHRLAEQMEQAMGKFDYIIYDPPPTVGLLTVSALAASGSVYIPMQMHFLAMEGLAEMMRLIYSINASWNPGLRLAGIIPTFYNKTTRIAREITADIRNNFGTDRLLPGIRMNVSLAEAPGHGQTIFDYAPRSAGAEDYIRLADAIDSNGK